MGGLKRQEIPTKAKCQCRVVGKSSVITSRAL